MVHVSDELQYVLTSEHLQRNSMFKCHWDDLKFIQHCHEDDCIYDNCYSIDSNMSLWIIQQQR
ncbi:hypothetical protein EWB00_000848 [Schistosoma japonicum]|uniref:Uncharacterized protein n=1 Tax=Schistosoma japonicum TaxID=6182 RepID=A0A4Z2DHS3_SCHJA|nr:hypothetical protein EWB00_000848 [Schistosoma japonicum]